MKTRTTYSADFKAKLALEVIKGHRTLAEIASDAQVHPNLLTHWKRQLLESLPTVFSDKRARENKEQEAWTDQLYQQIGQLKVELDWLKKSQDVSVESLRQRVEWEHPSLSILRQCQLLGLSRNLFKSFTDIQVAAAKGAGLAMQRTYNSQDDRIGPFGQGWTHAYDIRTEEENPATNYSDNSLNVMDRTDFFGGKQKYHRDADGLYSPPPYLFDETDAEYDKFLISGPIAPLADVEHGMDGTIKHFVTFAGSHERVCDYIQDRYGNTTTLVYTQATVGGQTMNLLASVTDPSGRQILYTWTNLGTTAQPAWRITQAQGPQYAVAYSYNADFNLSAATLDAGNASHLNRTTTFGYTAYSGASGTESGLLSSVTDALGHSISYTYAVSSITSTVWVKTITEPGSGGNVVWTIGTGVSYGSIPFGVTAISNANNMEVNVAVDTQLRKAFMSMNYAYLYQNTYDSANNVTFLHNAPSAFLPGQNYIAIINDFSFR